MASTSAATAEAPAGVFDTVKGNAFLGLGRAAAVMMTFNTLRAEYDELVQTPPIRKQKKKELEGCVSIVVLEERRNDQDRDGDGDGKSRIYTCLDRWLWGYPYGPAIRGNTERESRRDGGSGVDEGDAFPAAPFRKAVNLRHECGRC